MEGLRGGKLFPRIPISTLCRAFSSRGLRPCYRGGPIGPYLSATPQKVATLRPRASGPAFGGLRASFRGPRSPVFRAASPYSDLRVRSFSYLRGQLFTARLRRTTAEGLRFAAFDCVTFVPCRLLRRCRTMRFSHIRCAAPTALLNRAEILIGVFGASLYSACRADCVW